MSPRAEAGGTIRRPYVAHGARMGEAAHGPADAHARPPRDGTRRGVADQEQETASMTTPTRPDPLPWVMSVLTFVTGIVDAVSVLGLGRVFTANMTGNVVFLGFAAAGVSEFSIARSLTALAAFLAGAVLGGRLGSRMAEPGRLRWLRTAAACEAALLVVAGLASIGFNLASAPLTLHLHALIVLTAVAMGLRNATVRRLAVPDLTTTVLTLTLTGIAADSSLARGKNPRFRYRAASVVFMF